MRSYLSARRVSSLVIPCGLLALLVVRWAAPSSSSALGTHVFSGHVYVGPAGTTPLSGVSLSLWGSTATGSPEIQLGRPTTSGLAGAYSLSTDNLDNLYFHIVVDAWPPGYTPLRAEPGSGGAAVSATWIRFRDPDSGAHTGNNYRLSAPPTAVPTRTATRSATATKTPTPTATAANVQVLDLCASADASIGELIPSKNYGESAYLPVERYADGGTKDRVLLRFGWPSIPAGAVVQSATLHLHLIVASGEATVPIAIYPITEDWQEGTVTWANQPDVTQFATVQTFVGSDKPADISWSVTDLVQEWVSGQRPNWGLELRGPDLGDYHRWFESSEMPGGICPRLEIVVQSDQPIASLTPSRTPTPTATRTPLPTATSTPWCPTEPATGSTFADAVSLTLLNSVVPFEGYVCPAGDLDWLKFPALVGQSISVELDDVPIHDHVILYRPDGSEAWDSAQNPDTREVIYRTAEQSGDWRVRISGSTSTDWAPSRAYQLWVSVCAAWDEGSWGAPGDLGLITSGYICPSNDEDTYAIEVPDAQALSISVQLYNLPADYDLYIYDPAGTLRRKSEEVGTASELVTAVGNMAGQWKVQVKPKSAADHSATQPYWLSATLETDLDLTVKWIEVSQVTQTYLENGIPLIVGKPALARVYVGTGDAIGPIENVTVELTGYRDCLGCTPLPGSPLNLGPRSVTKQHTQSQRLSTDGFSVILPESWHKAGTLYLRAKVYAPPQQPEITKSNNTGQELVQFVTRAPVNLVLTRILAAGLAPGLTGEPALDRMVSYMRDGYPTSGIALWYLLPGQAMVANYDFTIKGTGGCGPSWSALLADLAYVRAHTVGVPAGFMLYGVMHEDVPSAWGGCGSYTQMVAAGLLNVRDDVLAHEAGHMLGVHHAPCGDPENPQAGFPTYSNPLGGSFPSASIGEVGVRLSSGLEVFDPSETYDLMSYCGPSWFSPENYAKLMGAIPALAAQLQEEQAQSPQLVAIGEVQEGHILLPRPLWVQPMPDSPIASGEGPYRIEVQDAAGGALSSRSYDLVDPYHGGATESGVFSEILPYPAGAVRVVFSREGVVLRTVTASAHAPTVTLTYPNGGETWAATGTYTITWQMGDDDGDALTSSLFTSRDDGATWNLAAANLTGARYGLDVDLLPGGDQVRFRVDVTDGLLTCSDASDGSLRVPNKAPLVFVLGPAPRTVLAPGEPALLSALATDVEDGPVSSPALSWSSDRDGALGSGADLAVANLSLGWHTLTATARDSSGATGQAAVRVLVGEPLWLPLVVKVR
jgi:hypothetical protein